MPESWVVFAIPKFQIMKLKECWEPPSTSDGRDEETAFDLLTPRLGNFGKLKLDAYDGSTTQRLHLAFQYSKDGVPSFACSAKPTLTSDKYMIDDFLWVDNVSGPSMEISTREWWYRLGCRIKLDRFRWQNVQQAMAKFSCLVEVRSKSGAGWVDAPPEQLVAAGAGNSRLGSGGVGVREGGRRDQGSSRLRYELLRD